MKVLALYLPQYHEIPENNEWWGTGYTEWTAVRNAKPFFKGHKVPHVPMNKNYYDLSDENADTWKWQAKLAREYGIFGFCIYHYWFEGKQLLEKPMEILRNHPEIDINYCICWANETWSRNWYGQNREILQEQTYGDENAWRNHFEYLASFFSDPRYIKVDNKPVINIYHSHEIERLPEMKMLWNRLAVELGYEGIYLISGYTAKGKDTRTEYIDAHYMFNPGYVLKQQLTKREYALYLGKVGAIRFINKFFKRNILEHKIDIRMIYRHIENDEIESDCLPCTFPQWDNTPRTGNIGICYVNASPKRFHDHLQRVFERFNKDKMFLYINAWNEWGEGAYLEPDEEYGYAYAEAIKENVKKYGQR